MADHTCVVSSMKNGGRKASAKTIGSLIMHMYDGVKKVLKLMMPYRL